MFGIGMPEMIMILAIALIVLGPQKLPDLAKSLGRAMREFKKATSELKESIEIDTDMDDVKKAFNEINRDIKKPIDTSGESPRKTEDAGNTSEIRPKNPEDTGPKDADDSSPEPQDDPDAQSGRAAPGAEGANND